MVQDAVATAVSPHVTSPRPPLLVVVLALALVGCGTRTDPDGSFDRVDATPDLAVPDTSEAAVDTSPAADALPEAPLGCPARRPRESSACDIALEGVECPYGTVCRTGCVCERGSWICLEDTCASSCPKLVPYGQPCDQLDRECDYRNGCPSTCVCDPAGGGLAWGCFGPPC